MFSLILFVCLGVLSTSNAMSFNFTPKGSTNQPCVLLDIDFNITMKMEDGGKEYSYNINSDLVNKRNITVVGSCGLYHSALILQFSKGTQWSFVFKTDVNGTVSLKRILQINPKNVFGQVAGKYSTSMSFNDTSEVISDVGSSYSCNAARRTEYKPTNKVPGNATFTIISIESSVSAQGFNVTNGRFGPPIPCDADKHTTHTTPPSTITTSNTTSSPTSPMTTLSPLPPVNEYIVKDDNKTCIVLMAAMEISIGYTANSSSGEELRTKTFQIPANAKSSGTCTGILKSQTLEVFFENGWSLNFTFSTDDDEMALSTQEDRSYKLLGLELSYVLDKTHFPGALEPDTPKKVAANKLYLTKPEGSGYYQCNSTVDLVIDGQHKVQTSFLQFKAFNDNEDVGFSGSASSCFKDDDSDQMVPIIVGSVMGGLLLIILIAFLIHRYRKRSEYDDLRG